MRLSRQTRLARVEAQEPETAWQHMAGISAMLAYAHSLPKRDPWDVEDLGEEPTGLGKLLKEAREWEEHPRRAQVEDTQQRRNGT
jgi:hypothetical protein